MTFTPYFLKILTFSEITYKIILEKT